MFHVALLPFSSPFVNMLHNQWSLHSQYNVALSTLAVLEVIDFYAETKQKCLTYSNKIQAPARKRYLNERSVEGEGGRERSGRHIRHTVSICPSPVKPEPAKRREEQNRGRVSTTVHSDPEDRLSLSQNGFHMKYEPKGESTVIQKLFHRDLAISLPEPRRHGVEERGGRERGRDKANKMWGQCQDAPAYSYQRDDAEPGEVQGLTYLC